MHLPGRILLIACCFSFSLLARGQLISLSVEKQSLEKVLMLIEQQTEYRFIYSGEMMSAAKPVTAEFKNETLVKALDLCFKEQPLAWAISEKHIVLQFKKVGSQEKRLLRGRVVNEQGEGLAGISVMVKGTGKGTISNGTGMFELADVPDRFRLVVSGIQIEEAEIMVGTEDFVKVETVQKLTAMDQTVVIGYGKSKRRDLVESVSRVKGEDITKQPISNPVMALAGRTAGLLVSQVSGVPGSAVRVQLRGRNSLVNGNDPLYIVDGVPFPATSLGDVFFGAGVTLSILDNLNPATIESIEILKDAAATAIYGSRGANGVILITTKKGKSQRPQVMINAYGGVGRISRKLPLMGTQEFLSMRREAFLNDNVTPTNSNAPDLKIWDTTRYTDWQEHLIGNNVYVSDLNASVMIGNAHTRVLASTGYRSESTVYPSDFGPTKISGMLNLNHQTEDKRLDVSVSVSFLQNETMLPKEDPFQFIKLAPNAPAIFNSEGRLNWENSSWSNPYSALLQTFYNRSETWQSSLQISYRLWKSLELRLSTGFTSISQTEQFRSPVAAFNPAQSPVSRAGFGNKGIRTRIIEPQAVYNFSFGAKHNVDILAGGSFQLSDQDGRHVQGSGYSSDDLLGSLAAASTTIVANETNIRYRYAAAFGRAQYRYLKRYLFNISVRRDGSSRYGPENRFANFGSIGFGWVISSENWMKQVEGIQFAKIRLSAGTTGNDQIGDYRFLDLYGPYSYTYQGSTTLYPIQLFSPSFGWEKVKKLEGGLDLTIAKNRVNITLNYFHNITTNQLVNYTLPSTTGFTGVLKNVPAKIRNTGLELETDALLVQQKYWRWSASFNLTIPRNKLVEFENFASSTYANTYVLGKPTSIVKTYTFLGVDPATGLYVIEDVNKDGRLTAAADQQNAVITAVGFYGGLENVITWKKLSFSFHFTFTQQPNIRNFIQLFNKPGSIDNQPIWVKDRWTKPTDETGYQRYTVTASAPNMAYSSFRQSDASWSNGSFVRLRNTQISYQWGFAKVYVGGQNLLLFTKYKGADPETNISLPPLKMVTCGVQFNL